MHEDVDEAMAERKAQLVAAAKAVKAEKPPDAYMLVSFGAYGKYVLPYGEGVKLMECMQHAEFMEPVYNAPPNIRGIREAEFTVTRLPAKAFKLLKMAQLLEITEESLLKEMSTYQLTEPLL